MSLIADEKLPLVRPQYNEEGVKAPPHTRQPIPLYRWIISITIAVFVLYINIPKILGNQSAPDRSEELAPVWQDITEFEWTKLKPSTELQYVPCYRTFYCARLEVPLDWNSTNPDSTRAVLAVIKRPAEVDVTDPSYGGAILFNPGGPGGSGVQFMNLGGEELATILNYNLTTTSETYANESRYYDLISWDPRGIGNTIPTVAGYPSERTQTEFTQRYFDLLGSLEHPELFNRAYDLQGLYGKLISSPQDGFSDDEHPARFAGTTSVVRDMVEIIEKHGEWRQKAAKTVIDYKKAIGMAYTTAEETAIQERTAYVKDKEMLQYWGFSYGTIVGQTFASMYPDRVGRLAIDGVVNATDYYAGDWKTDLIDSENILKNFTLECEAAGPKACPFSELTHHSSQTLLDGYAELIKDLRRVPLTGLVGKDPVYVTDFIVNALLFAGWYNGFFAYNAAGKMLLDAANRNASGFHFNLGGDVSEKTATPYPDRGTAQPMIVCMDATSRVNETREEYYKYVEYVVKQSPNFGTALTRISMPCHGFDIKPKWRFAGPFGGKTANPLLIMSQTLDPITPLVSAQGASTLFPGSGVVEAQGIGHTTLGYPSICAMKEVKKYFLTGKIPRAYTKCAAALRPFPNVDAVVQLTDELPLEDRYLMAAGLKIAKDFPPGNEALKYGNKIELPEHGAGDWWSSSRQVRITAAAEYYVNLQYGY